MIVPLDHPLAVKDEVRLEDTIPYKQIIFKKRSGLRQIIDGLFECIGQTPDVAYEIDEDQVAAGFVSNGFGICVAPNIPILQSLNVKILPLSFSKLAEKLLYGNVKECLSSACCGGF